jgi:hypothetical protein
MERQWWPARGGEQRQRMLLMQVADYCQQGCVDRLVVVLLAGS